MSFAQPYFSDYIVKDDIITKYINDLSAILAADPNFRSNSNEKHYDNETKADSSFEDNDSNSSQKSKEHAMNGEYLTLHKYHLVVVNDRILFRFACRKQREKYCCIIGTFNPICGLDGVLGMCNPQNPH